MAVIEQLGGLPVTGADVSFKNFGVSDIAAGTVVKADTSNPPSPTLPGGVVAVTDDTNVLGVALETLVAGKMGRVRLAGGAVCTAGGTITFGDVVMSANTGTVVAQTAGKYQLGIALSSAASTEKVLVWIDKAKNA